MATVIAPTLIARPSVCAHSVRTLLSLLHQKTPAIAANTCLSSPCRQRMTYLQIKLALCQLSIHKLLSASQVVRGL